MAARRESARVARARAKSDHRDVVEVYRSRLSGRWRWARWAPNGKQVGASEQGHRDCGYVVEKVRKQNPRITIVVAGRRRSDAIDVIPGEVVS